MGKRHTFMTQKGSLIISIENYCIAKVRPVEIKSPTITCVISLLEVLDEIFCTCDYWV